MILRRNTNRINQLVRHFLPSLPIHHHQQRTLLTASIENKIAKVEDEVNKFSKLLEEGINEQGRPLEHHDYSRIAKIVSSKTPLVDAFNEYTDFKQEVEDLQQMINDQEDPDEEMKMLAREELPEVTVQLETSEKLVLLLLAPKDAADERGALIEIRAGAGGDESSLFASELIKMYTKYSENIGWKVEMITQSQNEALSGVSGGTKEASIKISSPPYSEEGGVFGRLKHESGVHRVQRVPKTESQGRLHTSAVAVVVLPQAVETDVKLNESDLKIETYRSSGAGGQSVNTTDSAVRITHVPTGLTVSMQDERSQHRNRAKALSVLLSRLYDHERSIVNAERNSERNAAVTTADRSQRIRTYNFPQSRVTDHRINVSITGNLDNFMNGTPEVMNEIIDAMIEKEAADALLRLFDEE